MTTTRPIGALHHAVVTEIPNVRRYTSPRYTWTCSCGDEPLEPFYTHDQALDSAISHERRAERRASAQLDRTGRA